MLSHSSVLQQVNLAEIIPPPHSHYQPMGYCSGASARHKSIGELVYQTPLTLASFWCIRSSSMVFCSSKSGAMPLAWHCL